MIDGIELQEMVFAAIASDLELGAKPNHGTGLLGFSDGLLDVLQIAVEIHGPLVQITRRYLQQPHCNADGFRERFELSANSRALDELGSDKSKEDEKIEN